MNNNKAKTILAIESSCDETAAAVIKISGDKPEILSNVVSSQIDIHKQYGGVVPEVAARHHVINILPVVMEAMATAKVDKNKLDLIAVTAGPGLITSLIVGVEAAKALSAAWRVPLLAVNHMYGHIAGNFLQPLTFPAVCLVVSGGHTEIVVMKDHLNNKKVGQTVDDAAGEAFDKVAKLLGLGYPGGPIVSAKAEEFSGRNPKIKLPRPMLGSQDFNFSFSGLKTAVLYAAQKMSAAEKKARTGEICHEFQNAVIDVLVGKTIKAAKKIKAKTVLLAGGVAANKKLRERLKAVAEENGFKFFVPEFKLCTDNAAMVGLAAAQIIRKKKVPLGNYKKVVVDNGWELN